MSIPILGAHWEEQLLPTESMRIMLNFGHLLFRLEKPYTTIGLVTGMHGIGKTCAARALQQEVQGAGVNNEPSCLYLRVPPQCTPRGLLHALSSSISSFSYQNGVNTNKTAVSPMSLSVLLAALASPRQQLLIVDEVEYLRPECYELLRYLFEQTHCPVLLIGGPRLAGTVESHPPLSACIGLEMTFAAPTEDEVLYSVLPDLMHHGWSFDPHNDLDLQVGKEVWRAVRPSLRRLQVLLQTASHLAAGETDSRRITHAILHQALDLLAFPSRTRFSNERGREDNETHSTVFSRKARRKRPEKSNQARGEDYAHGAF